MFAIADTPLLSQAGTVVRDLVLSYRLHQHDGNLRRRAVIKSHELPLQPGNLFGAERVGVIID